MKEINSKNTQEQPIRETVPENPCVNTVNTDFMREKIKQRPINRKKLLRRTVITGIMAALFGLIACISFLVLEPVLNNMLYPKEETNVVTFPEESKAEEMNPEDMIADDSQMADTAGTATVSQDEIEREVKKILSQNENTLSDYQAVYTELKKAAKEASKSMVTVIGVTSDYDWFNDPYQSTGKTSGVIVAQTNTQFLIAANAEELADAEEIQVTFSVGTQVPAKIKAQDSVSGIAVLSVDKSLLTEDEQNDVKVATLGSSAGSELTGSPVIAIGAPTGSLGSVCYGSVTGVVSSLDTTDSNYKLITTDIYGSRKATGVVINLSGQVIGFTDMHYNSTDTANLLSAVGITELKSLIQKLSNGKTKAYLGIHGTDVTAQTNEELGVPIGAYVTRTEMDSPAMNAGIQSGDVITGFAGREILSYSDLVNALYEYSAGRTVQVNLQRNGPDGYSQMTVSVVLK